MVNEYTYSPVPEKAIRLLRFAPDAARDNLACELADFPLDDAPNFNALSYCWGSHVRSVSIRCNGRDLMVTPVLVEALQDLLEVDRAGVEWLWIDQVCIDQSNLAERGSQVNMMNAIYRTSERTVIWLGSAISNLRAVDPLLANLSRLYSQDIEPTGARRRRRYTSDEFRALGLPRDGDPSWRVLGHIFSRPWFVRSWVIQEAALSRQTPWLLCGTQLLPWEALIFSGTWIASMATQLAPIGESGASATATFRSLKLFGELAHVGLPWDLTTALNKTIRFRASNPRDRVYSLVGLTRFADSTADLPPALRATYDRPVRDVFRDVTRHVIATSGTLRVLTLIRYTTDWAALPSWVVDFNRDVEWERLSYFAWTTTTGTTAAANATSGTKHVVAEVSNHAAAGCPVELVDSPATSLDSGTASDGDDVLSLRGFCVDAIETQSAIMSSRSLGERGSEVLEVWAHGCRHLVGGARFPTTKALAQALMVTLSADWNLTGKQRMLEAASEQEETMMRHFWAYMWEARDRLLARADADTVMGVVPTLPDESRPNGTTVNDDANVFGMHLDAAHRRRVFFTRDQAYMGLGPAALQPGDVLCVLFGGATPMALRPVDGGGTGRYRFVGECYVPGLMEGEAVEDLEAGRYRAGTFSLV